MRCSCDDHPEWFQGDDTNAFGRHCIQVNRPSGIGDDVVITKAVLQCGPIVDVKDNPEFPYYIDFSSCETKQLQPVNKAYLLIFDENGLRTTCKGSITLKTKPQQVYYDE